MEAPQDAHIQSDPSMHPAAAMRQATMEAPSSDDDASAFSAEPSGRRHRDSRKRMGGFWSDVTTAHDFPRAEPETYTSAEGTAAAYSDNVQRSQGSEQHMSRMLLALVDTSDLVHGKLKFSASRSGSLLAAYNAYRVSIINVTGEPIVQRTLQPAFEPDLVQVSDNGALIVMVSSDSKLECLRLGTTVDSAGSLQLETPAAALALSPDSSLLAIAHKHSIELVSLSSLGHAPLRRSIPCPPIEHLQFSSDGIVLLGTTLQSASAFTLAIHSPTAQSAQSQSLEGLWLNQPFFPNGFPRHSLASLLPSRNGQSSALAYDHEAGAFKILDLHSFHVSSGNAGSTNRGPPPHVMPAVDAKGELVAICGADGIVKVQDIHTWNTVAFGVGSLEDSTNQDHQIAQWRVPKPVKKMFWSTTDHSGSIHSASSRRLISVLQDVAAPSIAQAGAVESLLIVDLGPQRGAEPLTEGQLDLSGDRRRSPTTSGWSLESHLPSIQRSGVLPGVGLSPWISRMHPELSASSSTETPAVRKDGTTAIGSVLETQDNAPLFSSSHVTATGTSAWTMPRSTDFDPDDSPTRWTLEKRNAPLPKPVLQDQKFVYGTLPPVELDQDLLSRRSRQSLNRFASKSIETISNHSRGISHDSGLDQRLSNNDLLQSGFAVQQQTPGQLQSAQSLLSLQSQPSGISSAHELGFVDEQSAPGFPELLVEDISRNHNYEDANESFHGFAGSHNAEQRQSQNPSLDTASLALSKRTAPYGLPGVVPASDITDATAPPGPHNQRHEDDANLAFLRSNEASDIASADNLRRTSAEQCPEQAPRTPEFNRVTSNTDSPAAHSATQNVEDGGSAPSRRGLRRVLSFNMAEKAKSDEEANSIGRFSDADESGQLTPERSREFIAPRPHNTMVLPLQDFPDLAANHARTEPYADFDQESSSSTKYRIRRRPLNSVHSASDMSDEQMSYPVTDGMTDEDYRTHELHSEPMSRQQQVSPPATPLEELYDYLNPPSPEQVDSLSRRLGSSSPTARPGPSSAPKAALGAGRRITSGEALRSHPPDPIPPPPANEYRSYRSTFSHGTPLYTIPSMNSLKTLPKSDGRPSIELVDEPVPEIPSNYKTEAQIAAVAAASGVPSQPSASEVQASKAAKKARRRSWDLLKRVGGSKSIEALSSDGTTEEAKRRKTSSLRSKDSDDWASSVAAVGDVSDVQVGNNYTTGYGSSTAADPGDTSDSGLGQSSKRSRSSLRQRISGDWARFRSGTPDSTAHSSLAPRDEPVANIPATDSTSQPFSQGTSSSLHKQTSNGGIDAGSSNVSFRGNPESTNTTAGTTTEPNTTGAIPKKRSSPLRQRFSGTWGSGRNSMSDVNGTNDMQQRGEMPNNLETRRSGSRLSSFRKRFSDDWAMYTGAPPRDNGDAGSVLRAVDCGGIVTNGAIFQENDMSTTPPVLDHRPARKHRISGVWTRSNRSVASINTVTSEATPGNPQTADNPVIGSRPTDARISSQPSTTTAKRIGGPPPSRSRNISTQTSAFSSTFASSRVSEDSDMHDETGDWAMGRHIAAAPGRPQLAPLKRLSGSFTDWARTRSARGSVMNSARGSIDGGGAASREDVVMSGGNGNTDSIEAAVANDTTEQREAVPPPTTRPILAERTSTATSLAGSVIRRLSGTDWAGGSQSGKPSKPVRQNGPVFGSARASGRVSEDSLDEGVDWALSRHLRLSGSRSASQAGSRRTSAIFKGKQVASPVLVSGMTDGMTAGNNAIRQNGRLPAAESNGARSAATAAAAAAMAHHPMGAGIHDASMDEAGNNGVTEADMTQGGSASKNRSTRKGWNKAQGVKRGAAGTGSMRAGPTATAKLRRGGSVRTTGSAGASASSKRGKRLRGGGGRCSVM